MCKMVSKFSVDYFFDDDRMSQNFETKLRQSRYLANGYVNNWVACLPGLINKVPNADRVSRLWQH